MTDGNGKTKWEDRLAYSDSRVVVDIEEGMQFVKVADEVPSWVTANENDNFTANVWISNGIAGKMGGLRFNNDCVGLSEGTAWFITVDNAEYMDLKFPKKGVYFISAPNNIYTTGIASADSDTPEITWDGNIGVIKTIDPKYIPSELNEIILPSSTSGSTKQFKITVDDSGTISATEV